jgi:hypothetical protein
MTEKEILEKAVMDAINEITAKANEIKEKVE